MMGDWSRQEVEATVSDYFDMLSSELRGQSYSKAEHRRRLLQLLDGRSEGAVERKHGNISAVMIALGYPYIEGYKPFANYQHLLFDVVAERLGRSRDLESIVLADVDANVSPPSVAGILDLMTNPPRISAARVAETLYDAPGRKQPMRSARPRVNYLLREAQNAALGSAGEDFVVQYERARLATLGKSRLADSVERISLTQGDGAGFDVLSFEESGAERLIEVKTTRYGASTPFFVSRNEVQVSETESERYHLYRVFTFRRRPQIYSLSGSFRSHFDLDPIQYRASLAAR